MWPFASILACLIAPLLAAKRTRGKRTENGANYPEDYAPRTGSVLPVFSD
jgi:hypothetical protein